MTGTRPPSRADTGRKTRQTKMRNQARLRQRRRLGWIGRLVLACCLVVLGLFGWAALARQLAPTSNTSLTRFDAIIVLGAPTDEDGNPSPIQLARVTEAVHEYERGVAPRLILSGGVDKIAPLKRS